MTRHPWPRRIGILGLIAVLFGTLDPLEGSLLILPGAGLLALAAFLAGSRHRTLLYWSFALVTVGVATLWGVSAVGGFGGRTGRPMWWALSLLPYPIGWVLALVGAIRLLRESPPPALGSHS